ncbi:MAG: DUF4336 domain-containing protein [Candidatus Sericytochromatia bacterium]
MPELTLRRSDTELWLIDHPLRALGAHLGTRTSVIRLADGSLWLLSPGPGLESLKAELEALVPVSALVAPNAMHHLSLPATLTLFPEATVYGPPGLKAKQPDLPYLPYAQAPWAAEIPRIEVQGLGGLEESAFYHRPSRSLLVTDLVFNIRRSQHLWTRLFMILNDGYGRFGPTRVLRSLLKDPEALRASLEAILAWDFERVVMAHGEVLESDGRRQLQAAYARIGVLPAGPVPV